MTVLNVVGMVGTGMQNAAMKVVRSTTLSSSEPSSPIPSHSIASTTRRKCCPSPKRTYTSSTSNISSHSACDGLAGYTIPLYDILAVQKPPAGSPEPVRTPGPLDPSTLEFELARVGLRTVVAMVNAGWPAMLSFLLTTNLSDPLFGDVLGVLQALARTAGYLALSTPRDATRS